MENDNTTHEDDELLLFVGFGICPELCSLFMQAAKEGVICASRM
jgi:hypothetical protein